MTVMDSLAVVVGPGDGVIVAAWGVTALSLALAWFGRRRFSIGVSEGLFVAAVSGLLTLNYVTRLESEREFLLGVILVTLAIVWFIAAVWVEREPDNPDRLEPGGRRAIRRDLAVHAAAIAGLLAVAVMLSASAAEHALTMGLIVLLALLLVVVTGLYVWRRGAATRHAIVAVLVTLLWMAVPHAELDARRTWIALGLLLLAVAALAVVIVRLLGDWRQRIHTSRQNPTQLTEHGPQHRLIYGTVVMACVVVGVIGVMPARTAITPFAVWLAAYACLTVGHLWRSNSIGEIGLALVGEAVVLAAVEWLPESPANGLLGMTLAGALLLWFARFWHQQLNDGQPWTTTGRLIPVARNLSYAAASGQLALAALWVLRADDAAMPAGWLAGAALVFGLLHSSMLVRDAQTQSSSTPALAAGLALIAAAVPAAQLTARWAELTPGFWLALFGLLLALRVCRTVPDAAAAWVYNACIGGLLPVAAVYALVLHQAWLTGRISMALAGAAIALAICVRWGLRPPGTRVPRMNRTAPSI